MQRFAVQKKVNRALLLQIRVLTIPVCKQQTSECISSTTLAYQHIPVIIKFHSKMLEMVRCTHNARKNAGIIY